MGLVGLLAATDHLVAAEPAPAAAPVSAGPSRFRKVVLDADHDLDGDGKPEDTFPDLMEIGVAGDGRVFLIERAGTVRGIVER